MGERSEIMENIENLVNVNIDEANRIAEENIGLLRAAAHRWAKCGLSYEDAFSAGAEGLIHASRHYDASSGYTFATYAIKCIDGYIAKSRREQQVRPLPHYVEEKRAAVRRAVNTLMADGQAVDPDAIGEIVGLDADIVSAILAEGVSMDAEGVGSTMADDSTSPDELLEKSELPDSIRQLMLDAYLSDEIERKKQLIEKQKQANKKVSSIGTVTLSKQKIDLANRQTDVILARYLDGDTLQSVAERMGITRERVRQLEAGGLAMLKKYPEKVRELLA